jgi:hypothetical protein
VLTNAQVAQLVEHATENRSVGGSIPPLGTMLKSNIFLSNITPKRAAENPPPFARGLTADSFGSIWCYNTSPAIDLAQHFRVAEPFLDAA